MCTVDVAVDNCMYCGVQCVSTVSYCEHALYVRYPVFESVMATPSTTVTSKNRYSIEYLPEMGPTAKKIHRAKNLGEVLTDSRW